MRLWPWWPTLLLAATARAGTPTRGPGLYGSVARALDRIRESRRDVRLAEDLWFETLRPGRPPPPVASKSPPPADLLALADAVFDTHRLSWRNALVQGTDFTVYKDGRTLRYAFAATRPDEGARRGDSGTRTFGVLHRRRLQMVMLPIMYKLGVITTLLTGLTVLSLKGVTIGVILLILAVTGLASKAARYNHYAAAPATAYGPAQPFYDPYDRSSQPAAQPPQDKNIHVHVHAAPYAPHAPYAPPPPLSPDESADYRVPPYWTTRGDDDYYDAATRHERTTAAANTVYHRWLG